jgi:4-hydroxyphenylacetate 3-monooxygenase
MPIRRGDEYLASLRDGRRLWLMGQRVEDVTTHPALAGCARSVAAVYDPSTIRRTRICWPCHHLLRVSQ